MYQFFINSEDSKVIDYLKFLTFLSKEEIEELERKHNETPHLREAHKALAKAVISFLHSEDDYNQAVKISNALFSGDLTSLTVEEVEMGFGDFPKLHLQGPTPILDLVVTLGAASSKREAREFVKGGAVTLNGQKITDENTLVNQELAIGGKYVIVRRGKKKYYISEF